MGTLFYGSARAPIRIDDRVIAHLKAVATAKMRRGEGFLISWTNAAVGEAGRNSIWISPMCDLHYKFDDATPMRLSPELLEEMNVESIQPRGIDLSNPARS